jgi:hypothetical protein
MQRALVITHKSVSSRFLPIVHDLAPLYLVLINFRNPLNPGGQQDVGNHQKELI